MKHLLYLELSSYNNNFLDKLWMKNQDNEKKIINLIS